MCAESIKCHLLSVRDNCAYNCYTRSVLRLCALVLQHLQNGNTIKTRYDVTFNNFMEWHFCAIRMYYGNFDSILSESRWSKSPCCTVLKNIVSTFITMTHKISNKNSCAWQTALIIGKKHTIRPTLICNYFVTKTVQFTSNCTTVCVCKWNTCTTKISWQMGANFVSKSPSSIIRRNYNS